jgi:hypothetical protein
VQEEYARRSTNKLLVNSERASSTSSCVTGTRPSRHETASRSRHLPDGKTLKSSSWACIRVSISLPATFLTALLIRICRWSFRLLNAGNLESCNSSRTEAYRLTTDHANAPNASCAIRHCETPVNCYIRTVYFPNAKPH